MKSEFKGNGYPPTCSEFLSMEKVLKEKYPEEDIHKLVQEGQYDELLSMLLTQ